MIRSIAIAATLFAATHAQAYCVYNDTRDRDVKVEQETHPDSLRDERRFRGTIPPGGSKCCNFHELDCNPRGRNNSLVNLGVSIPGDPVYECAFPPGTTVDIKVTGSGTIRVQHNPNSKSANPYIVRIRTQDKDLTGPRGVPCTEPKPKSAPPPKGKK
jgi:hypothetical protein